MVFEFDGKKPVLNNIALCAPGSSIIGDAKLENDVSIWFGASIRADVDLIHIGKKSNIQDNATVHVNYNTPTIIGNGVTVGHNAVLHGCTIDDNCLIGMGAIVLDQVEIGEGSIVGAGALLTQGKKFPPRSLIIGSPAKVAGTVSDTQYEHILKSADTYLELATKTSESIKKQGN